MLFQALDLFFFVSIFFIFMSLCEMAIIGYIDKVYELGQYRRVRSQRRLRALMMGQTADTMLVALCVLYPCFSYSFYSRRPSAQSAHDANHNDGYYTTVRSDLAGRYQSVQGHAVARYKHGAMGHRIDFFCARAFPLVFAGEWENTN